MEQESTTPDIKDVIDSRSILVGLRGSQAHGLYVPKSDPDSIDDIDYMGVVVAPPEHYLGLTEWGSRGTKETFEGELDVVQYELRKFIGLLLVGNPNIISFLWLKPEQYPVMTLEGQVLIQNREAFHSKAMFRAFTGYAGGQLAKMGKFERRGFRGQKREELITRYGYDTKNAQHCVRLLRMCIETLETGEVHVDRTGIDAEELMAVKRGEWSQDRVIAESQALVAKAKEAYARSKLPELPDRDAAERICMQLIRGRI